MKQEEQRILETFRARGIRTGGFIHPAEFGDAIVWEGGNIRDEVIAEALSKLFREGYLIELNAGFELTALGDAYIYKD